MDKPGGQAALKISSTRRSAPSVVQDSNVTYMFKAHAWKRKGNESKYKPEFCEEVIELLAVEGLTLNAACGHFRVSRVTFDAWRAKYPEFNEACEVAVNCARLFMERLGNKGALLGRDFNHIAYCHMMWNRFGQTLAPAGDGSPEQNEGRTTDAEVTPAERASIKDYLEIRAANGGARG